MDFSIRLKPKTIFLVLLVFSCCLLSTAGLSVGGTYYYMDENFDLVKKDLEPEEKVEEEKPVEETPEEAEDLPLEVPDEQSTTYENLKYGYSLEVNEDFTLTEPVGADSATNVPLANEESTIVLVTFKNDNTATQHMISIKDYGELAEGQDISKVSVKFQSEKNCYRQDDTSSLNSIKNIKVIDEFTGCDNSKQIRHYFILNEDTGRVIELIAFYSRGRTNDIDAILETFELI